MKIIIVTLLIGAFYMEVLNACGVAPYSREYWIMVPAAAVIYAAGLFVGDGR